MKSLLVVLLSLPTLMQAQSSRFNWSYGPDSLQVMDYIQPAAPADSFATTMVLIHGGGWMGGDKRDMATALDSLRMRFPHYAFLNVNYRLARPGINLFPTQENDIHAALATLLKERITLNLSGDLVLFGVSAGAHLSLLYGYKENDSKHVKAVIDGFGPTDMVFSKASESQLNGFSKMMTGKDGAEGRQIMYDSSPINFVTADSPPTLILQGGKDFLVDPQQSKNLYAKLQAAGVKSQLVFYPEEGHGWRGANLTDSYNKMVQFLAELNL